MGRDFLGLFADICAKIILLVSMGVERSGAPAQTQKGAPPLMQRKFLIHEG